MPSTAGDGFVGCTLKNRRYGVLCFVDINASKYYDVSFEQGGKPCVLSTKGFESKVERYLKSPYPGEEVIFLSNNQKTGAGKIDSIGGGYSDYQGIVYCKVKEGREGNIVLSKSLYNETSISRLTFRDIRLDTQITSIAIQRLKDYLANKNINVGCLEKYQCTKQIPVVITPGEMLWFVTIEAKVKNLNKCKYIINAILSKENTTFKIDLVTANPTVSELDFTPNLPKRLYFIDLEGNVQESNYTHIESYIDFIDIEGDGYPEIVMSYWGYEGGGCKILKKIGREWKEIGSYYLGV